MASMVSNIQTFSEQEEKSVNRPLVFPQLESHPCLSQAEIRPSFLMLIDSIGVEPGWTTENDEPAQKHLPCWTCLVKWTGEIAELLYLCIGHLLSMFKGTAFPSREGSQFLVKDTSAWFSSWYMMRNSVPLILHENAPFQIHLGFFFWMMNQKQNERQF